MLLDKLYSIISFIISKAFLAIQNYRVYSLWRPRPESARYLGAHFKHHLLYELAEGPEAVCQINQSIYGHLVKSSAG